MVAEKKRICNKIHLVKPIKGELSSLIIIEVTVIPNKTQIKKYKKSILFLDVGPVGGSRTHMHKAGDFKSPVYTRFHHDGY